MNPIDRILRVAKIIWGAMVAHAILIMFVAERIWDRPEDNVSTETLFLPFLAFGITAVLVGLFFFRWRLIPEVAYQLNSQPTDITLTKKWFTYHIINFALVDSCILFGFALRAIGFDFKRAFPFYLIGLVGFLLSIPRRP